MAAYRFSIYIPTDCYVLLSVAYCLELWHILFNVPIVIYYVFLSICYKPHRLLRWIAIYIVMCSWLCICYAHCQCTCTCCPLLSLIVYVLLILLRFPGGHLHVFMSATLYRTHAYVYLMYIFIYMLTTYFCPCPHVCKCIVIYFPSWMTYTSPRLCLSILSCPPALLTCLIPFYVHYFSLSRA